MITFYRNGTKVEVKISTTKGWDVVPSFNCNDELYAILLRDDLQDKLGNVIERIRRDAYLQGYKDRSAKVAKKKEFNGNINSDTVGW